MKNLEFKMRLSLLIGGLALMVCCCLQCRAQTSNWGVEYVQPSGKKLYKENGHYFRGTIEQCEQKCKDLNAKKPQPVKPTGYEFNNDELVDEMNKISPTPISEGQRQEGAKVADDVKNVLNGLKEESESKSYYHVVDLSFFGSMFFPDEEYTQAAEKWKELFEEYGQSDFNGFVKHKYSALCKRYGFIENEEDRNRFKSRLYKTHSSLQ